MRLTRRSATALGLAAVASPAMAAAASPDARFEALGKAYVEHLVRSSPTNATTLGDHRFDTQVDDFSAGARKRRIADRKALLQQVHAIPAAGLSRANQVDHGLVTAALRSSIWQDEVLQDWAWDPQIYNNAAGGALYGLMQREFAPMPQRLQSAIARMQALPKLFEQARAAP